MRVVYDKLSKEIVTVIEDENSITAFPANLGVIQGDAEMIVQSATAIGLDVSQIPNLDMSPERKEVIQDRLFCREIQNKLLESQKDGQTLDPLVYRQMSDLFFYAKDAADNGNPSQVKYELQQIPDALPLANWIELKASLIAEIDEYLLQQ
jgi:hypothetical protein